MSIGDVDCDLPLPNAHTISCGLIPVFPNAQLLVRLVCPLAPGLPTSPYSFFRQASGLRITAPSSVDDAGQPAREEGFAPGL